MSPYNYAAGNPVRFFDKYGDKPSKYEAACMMDNTYNSQVHLSGEWKRSSLKFGDAKFINDDHNFISVLYEKDIMGKTEYCLVFAGTNPKNYKDIETCAMQVAYKSTSTEDARALALSAKMSFSRRKEPPEVTFAGHSQASTEVYEAVAATGWEGITANGLGLREDQAFRLFAERPNISSLIQNYVVIGDLVKDVNTIMNLNYIGKVTPVDPGVRFTDYFTRGDQLLSTIPGFGTYWSGKEILEYKLKMHAITTVKDSFHREEKEKK